jgi:drug/metabolite transporter (DMT)-like permease
LLGWQPPKRPWRNSGISNGSFQVLEPPPAPPSRGISAHRAYLLILFSAFSFALMTTCGHALGERCDWRITAVVRAGLVFLFTWVIAARRGTRFVVRGPRTLWVRSIAGSISMLLTFYAMARLPVGTLLTLTNTFPLWVTLLAWPVLGHRPTAMFAVALVSGVAGVALIEGPQSTGIRPATVAAILASFGTAVVMIGLHRLRSVEPLAIVVHFSAVATLACFSYSLVTASMGDPIDLTVLQGPITIGLLIGVGVCGTAGQVSMTRAFGRGRPQNLSIVFLSQVVFALAFDGLIWGRALTLLTLAGTLLILAPVAWLLTKQTPSTLTTK